MTLDKSYDNLRKKLSYGGLTSRILQLQNSQKHITT